MQSRTREGIVLRLGDAARWTLDIVSPAVDAADRNDAPRARPGGVRDLRVRAAIGYSTFIELCEGLAASCSA
jgi:hypothetical protein